MIDLANLKKNKKVKADLDRIFSHLMGQFVVKWEFTCFARLPNTKSIASMTLLFPLPLGPTTAEKLCQRLVLGSQDAQETGEGPCGVAAITLHGRSRQQRYTRSADWAYIAECASLVNSLKDSRAEVTDTVREPDADSVPEHSLRRSPRERPAPRTDSPIHSNKQSRSGT